MTLGESEGGRAWCLKALHPADPLTEVAGVPDQSAHSTTCLNFGQQNTFVSPNAGSGQNWDLTLYFNPDPTCFGLVRASNSAGTVTQVLQIMNSGFADGTSFDSEVPLWLGNFEHWRIAYAGVTAYLDAPALSNQGFITAAQYPIWWRLMAPGDLGWEGVERLPVVGGVSFRPTFNGGSDIVTPGYSSLVRMPNAYTGLAKDGCYMPLRLESNHSIWHDESDAVADMTAWPRTDDFNMTSPTSPILGSGLYPACQPLYHTTGESPRWLGGVHLLPLMHNAGSIAFKGISDAAQVRLHFRVGIEARANPSSSYAPYLKVSPPYDLTAITTYYKIARELKDAYPSEYNDLGKLWDTIKSVASFVAPIMGLVPGGQMLVNAGRQVGGIVDSLSRFRGRKDVVSAAQMERAKEAVAGMIGPIRQSLRVPPRQRRQKKSGPRAAPAPAAAASAKGTGKQAPVTINVSAPAAP